MAAKLALFSPTTTFLTPSTPSALHPHSFTTISPRRRPHSFKVHAELVENGGAAQLLKVCQISDVHIPTIIMALGGGDGEASKGGKKKFITREQEPEQYWQTAGEREGENPMMTPLPYIIIFGMSTPFVILAIAFANGWIKAPIR